MIRKKEPVDEIVIDLTGPDGNAHVLIGKARSIGTQLGMDETAIKNMIADMISGDYEHLLSVFDNHFGSFVILER